MPKCSIIIPVYNQVAFTRQCLHAIQDNTSNRVAYEIIVADDGSTDSTPQFLADCGDQIRVVTMPTNSGFGAACNAGAAIATGEYLVLLNNDTVPQADWLEALVDYAAIHQKAAVIGSKLLFPDGTVQHAGLAIRSDRLPILLYRCFPKDHPAVNRSRRFQMVASSCVLIRREWFKQLGGFDSAFRNGYDEADLCLRVGERGGEVHYCHQSVVWHLESATRVNQISAEFVRGQNLYLSRWAARLQSDDVDYYLKDGLLGLVGLLKAALGTSTNADTSVPSRNILVDSARQTYDLLLENVHPRLQLLEAGPHTSTNADTSVPSRNILVDSARQTYDLLLKNVRPRLQLLEIVLRASTNPGSRYPLWVSLLLCEMAAEQIIAQMYRERKKVVKI